MKDQRLFLQQLIKASGEALPDHRAYLLDRLAQDEEVVQAVALIQDTQQRIMAKWKLENRIADIGKQPVRILNATTGKAYESKLDFSQLGWEDIASWSFEGLEEVGLHYDEPTGQIMGTPTTSGDFKIKFRFRLEGEPEDAPLHEKVIPLVINPDPKSLWKTLESNQEDPYWKEDNRTEFAPLGDRHILVSSRRGRSHANVGSFREDDYAFRHLDNGWNVVVVADGAGSAKLSRKGSAIACGGVVDYFTEHLPPETTAEFDGLLAQHRESTGEDTGKKLNRFVYNHLGKGALYVHKKLAAFAAETGVPLKDLGTTLIFVLFRKYDAGYVFLSFGVGDCPIGILSRDGKEITLMNWLDVGEFGGGTRFITMPEIFQSEKFATRFNLKLMDDFSYLFLMSDGIYDPKFVVEANLEQVGKWQAFLADLAGKNEDGLGVTLDPGNAAITDQLSAWMDFWSPGNHDDRTLAIVF